MSISTWDPETVYIWGQQVFYNDYIYVYVNETPLANQPPDTAMYDYDTQDQGIISVRCWLPMAGDYNSVNYPFHILGFRYNDVLPTYLQYERGYGAAFDSNITFDQPPVYPNPTNKGVFYYIQRTPSMAMMKKDFDEYRYWFEMDYPFLRYSHPNFNNGYSVDLPENADYAYVISGCENPNMLDTEGFNKEIKTGFTEGGVPFISFAAGPGNNGQIGMFANGSPTSIMNHISQFGKDLQFRVEIEYRYREGPGYPWSEWERGDIVGSVNTGNDIEKCLPGTDVKVFLEPVDPNTTMRRVNAYYFEKLISPMTNL